MNVEQILRISVDVIQLQDIDPAFRLKVLREGIPLKMENDMHYALISQAFSELQDLKNFKDARYMSRMFWLGVDAYENAIKTMSFSHEEVYDSKSSFRPHSSVKGLFQVPM